MCTLFIIFTFLKVKIFIFFKNRLNELFDINTIRFLSTLINLSELTIIIVYFINTFFKILKFYLFIYFKFKRKANLNC